LTGETLGGNYHGDEGFPTRYVAAGWLAAAVVAYTIRAIRNIMCLTPGS